MMRSQVGERVNVRQEGRGPAAGCHGIGVRALVFGVCLCTKLETGDMKAHTPRLWWELHPCALP